MTDVDTIWCPNFVQNTDENFFYSFFSNSSAYRNYIDFDDVVDKSHPVVVDDNCHLVVVENNIHPADVQEENPVVDILVVDILVVDRIVVNPLNDE